VSMYDTMVFLIGIPMIAACLVAVTAIRRAV
jgi:hypothetical protein